LGDEALEPGRIQRIIVIGVSLVILLAVFIFIQDAESFLTINDAVTATQLSLETVGVHWSDEDRSPVTSQVDLSSQPDVSANSNDFVGIVWSQERDNESDVFYAYIDDASDDVAWSASVNVSNSNSERSSNPQLVMDENGKAHIVWEENDLESGTSQILYSHCERAGCLSPILLSSDMELACASEMSGDNNQWPSISIDASGGLMTAWSANAGHLLFSHWSDRDMPPQEPSGCIPISENITAHNIQTSLAAGFEGVFALAYSGGGSGEFGDIYLQYFEQETWSGPDKPIGIGKSPDVILDADDQVNVAWCDQDGIANYLNSDGSIEMISSPTCIGSPELALDQDGFPHLVWYSDQVENSTAYRSANWRAKILQDQAGDPEAIVGQRRLKKYG